MDGFDTASPNNQMAEQMIDWFLEDGHFVHLIQSKRTGNYPTLPPNLCDRDHLTCDTIQRPVVDKKNFVNRYLEEAQYAFRLIGFARKHRDCDVIFVQSCPTVFLQEILLKIFIDKPIVYNIYDVWPGQAKSLGINPLIYKGMELLQRIAYRLSSEVMVLSDDMALACEKAGCDGAKISVIPPWFDDRRTYDIPWHENRFVKKYDLSDEPFYVQFAGSIGLQFDYRTMFEVASILASEENIVIQIVGDGIVKQPFVDMVDNAGLKNVIFLPLQPIDLVPDVYSASDICLIPLRKEVIRTGTPSKMPILLACGKVIVSSVEKDSAYAAMVERENIGVCVDIGDAEELAATILALYNNKAQFNEIKARGLAYAHANLSREVCASKVLDLLKTAATE